MFGPKNILHLRISLYAVEQKSKAFKATSVGITKRSAVNSLFDLAATRV